MVDVKKLREMHAACVGGTWVVEEDIGYENDIVGWNIHNSKDEIIGCEGILGEGEAEARFIAEAYNVMPELLAELEALRRALAQ